MKYEKKDLEEPYKNALKKVKQNASIDGYRKGKAPDDIIKARYLNSITEEVKNDVVPKTGSEVLKKLDLHIVTYPAIHNIEVKGEDEITFGMTVETNPEFELKEYKDIKIKKKELKEVTDKDVEREINKIRQSRGQLKDAGRDEVKQGDYITASLMGFVDNKAEAELSGDNEMIIVGSKSVPEELDRAFVGMRGGKEQEVKVKFPKDYLNKKFAGKEALFKVNVKSIKVIQMPDLNDDFVKTLGNYKTVDEIKNTIKNELKRQAENEIRNFKLDQIFKELLKRNGFEIAQGLVEQEMNNMTTRYENNLRTQGLSVEKLGLKREEIREQNRAQANDNIRLRYIIRKIAESEKMEVADKDVEDEIKKVAEKTKENIDTLMSRAKSSWDALKAQLLEDRVIDMLLKELG